MAEFYDPVQTWREIEPNALPSVAKEMHDNGRRLLQLFCTYVNYHYEMVYMFDMGDYKVENVKVIAEPSTLVPSIGDYYPYATPYENEAIELFGVKIKMISLDYNDKLYRIKVQNPLGPNGEGDQNNG